MTNEMTNNNTYNGYTNYETWNFNTWHGEDLFNYVQATENDMKNDDVGDYVTLYDIQIMVEDYKNKIQDENREVNGEAAGFMEDVLGEAFRKIDVDNIAKNIYLDLKIEQ